MEKKWETARAMSMCKLSAHCIIRAYKQHAIYHVKTIHIYFAMSNAPILLLRCRKSIIEEHSPTLAWHRNESREPFRCPFLLLLCRERKRAAVAGQLIRPNLSGARLAGCRGHIHSTCLVSAILIMQKRSRPPSRNVPLHRV